MASKKKNEKFLTWHKLSKIKIQQIYFICHQYILAISIKLFEKGINSSKQRWQLLIFDKAMIEQVSTVRSLKAIINPGQNTSFEENFVKEYFEKFVKQMHPCFPNLQLKQILAANIDTLINQAGNLNLSGRIDQNPGLNVDEKGLLKEDLRREIELDEFLRMVYVIVPGELAHKAVAYIFHVWESYIWHMNRNGGKGYTSAPINKVMQVAESSFHSFISIKHPSKESWVQGVAINNDFSYFLKETYNIIFAIISGYFHDEHERFNNNVL